MTQQTAARQCLMVLGMHRSGTSAVTRTLSLLGIRLPHKVLGSNNTNQTGHWEPERVLRAHERLLRDVGSRWDDWRTLDLSVLPAESLDAHRTSIADLIMQEYDDAACFVIKEPRTSRFVPFYREILASIAVEPLFLHCGRHPSAVIASLNQRNGFTRDFASMLWLRHELDAELATRGYPRVFISYEQLLADWRATVDQIGHTLAIKWPRSIDEAAFDIEGHLSRDHQHHVSSALDGLASSQLREWVSTAYAALRVLELHADDTEAQRALDQIKAQLDRDAEVYGPVVYPEWSVRERQAAKMVDQADRHAVSLIQSLADLDLEFSQARSGHAATEAALRTELNEATTQLAALVRSVADLVDAEASRDRLADEQIQLHGRLDQSVFDIVVLQDKLTNAGESLRATREKNIKLEAAVEKSKANAVMSRKLYQGAVRQNEALRASSSWQLTRPLRGLKRSVVERGFLARLVRENSYIIARFGYHRLRDLRAWLQPPVAVPVAAPVSDLSATIVSPTDKRPILTAAAHQATIVIAVYNAAADVELCLDSVRRHSAAGQRVVVVDDCSPDPQVEVLLARYRAIAGWTVTRNAQNMGYTRTINAGIRAAGSADVVILNSDTIVTPLWLQRLRFVAYQEENIASVTPVSNNAGAFSVPLAGVENAVPAEMPLEEYARNITHAMGGAIIETPTGNGFCMYIKRAVLDAVGLFDEAAFPKGYGEENDFCMRAVAGGWRHMIDFSTYIYHKRSASFGSSKTDLIAHGRAVVDRRYPEYKKAVRALGLNQDAATYRDRIAALPIGIADGRPRLLFVISTTTGGTPQTNLDLMRQLEPQYKCFVLRSDSKKVELSMLDGGALMLLETRTLCEPIRPLPHHSDSYDDIVTILLHKYCIELVHIRHIGWHGLGLTSASRQYGVPVIFSFHDFYTVCPSVKLLDDKWAYCGGHCTPDAGVCSVELWDTKQIPSLKHDAVYEWRERMGAALQSCDEFVTTSSSAREIIRDHFPWIKRRPFHVIAHGRDIVATEAAPRIPSSGEALRILVLGNINEAKGNLVYRDIATRYPDWNVEFHILGKWRGRQIEDKRFFYHGAYDRDDIERHLQKIGPHCSAILSIWPETYCHTLTESWTYVMPIFAFNIGAVGERIANSGGGWLIDDFTAIGLHAAIKAAVNNPADWQAKIDDIRVWRADEEANPTCADMAAEYRSVYARYVRVEEPEQSATGVTVAAAPSEPNG